MSNRNPKAPTPAAQMTTVAHTGIVHVLDVPARAGRKGWPCDGGRMVHTRLTLERFATLTRDDVTVEDNRARWDNEFCSRDWRSDWVGRIGSWENAVALFTDGWPEGAARAESLADDVRHAVPQGGIVKRRTRRLMDDGGDLVLDRAMAGDWDRAFHGIVKADRRSENVVALTAGWVAPARIAHEDLIWNAVQMIVLTDALENAGWRVELRGIDGVYSNAVDNTTIMAEVLVKRPEEPLRADHIAATFGHAGVYRSLGFAVDLVGPAPVGFGLGRCLIDLNEQQAAVARLVAGNATLPSSLHLPRADSLSQCKQNIADAVAKLTGQLGAAQDAA